MKNSLNQKIPHNKNPPQLYYLQLLFKQFSPISHRKSSNNTKQKRQKFSQYQIKFSDIIYQCIIKPYGMTLNVNNYIRMCATSCRPYHNFRRVVNTFESR